MKRCFKDTSAEYDNISIILYEDNVVNSLRTLSGNNVENITVIEGELRDYYLNYPSIYTRLSSVYNLPTKQGIEDIKRLLIEYLNNIIGFSINIVEDYLNFLLHDKLDKYLDFSLKKGRLVFNFNKIQEFTDELIISNGLSIEDKKEEYQVNTLDYVICFYHFTLLLIIYSFIKDNVSVEDVIARYNSYKEQIVSGIVTGISATVDLKLPLPFGMFYEALSNFQVIDKDDLYITLNPEKQALEFNVKYNAMFHEQMRQEWKSKLPIKITESVVTNNKVALRVTKGNNPFSANVYFKCYGAETIGKIFLLDPARQIRTNTMYDSGMGCIRNAVLFCMRTVLNECIFDNSKCRAYIRRALMIERYQSQNSRYIPKRLAVLELMLNYPELQDEIISSITQFATKNELLKDLDELKNIDEKYKEYDFLKILNEGINYVW